MRSWTFVLFAVLTALSLAGCEKNVTNVTIADPAVQKKVVIKTTYVNVGRQYVIPVNSQASGANMQTLTVTRFGGARIGDLCLAFGNDLDRDNRIAYTNDPLPGVFANTDEWIDGEARQIGQSVYVNVFAYDDHTGTGNSDQMAAGRAVIRVDLSEFTSDELTLNVSIQVPRGLGATPARLVFNHDGPCGDTGTSVDVDEDTIVETDVSPSELAIFVDDGIG